MLWISPGPNRANLTPKRLSLQGGWYFRNKTWDDLFLLASKTIGFCWVSTSKLWLFWMGEGDYFKPKGNETYPQKQHGTQVRHTMAVTQTRWVHLLPIMIQEFGQKHPGPRCICTTSWKWISLSSCFPPDPIPIFLPATWHAASIAFRLQYPRILWPINQFISLSKGSGPLLILTLILLCTNMYPADPTTRKYTKHTTQIQCVFMMPDRP